HTPHTTRGDVLERLLEYDSVRLFVERAREGRAAFTLTPGDGTLVGRICRRLDGIPLAIEMAAARGKTLPLTEIASRLEEGLALLTGGDRSAIPRHQTLRATLNWSYELLSAKEQCLLQYLAVFVGDWTLEAAEAVCSHAPERLSRDEILDLLTTLVDKSLVVF